jgi:hypothetical protein
MIPPLNEHGVLPPGIYDCTLSEIQDRYATIPRRQKLWSGFQKYFELIKPLGFFPTIFFGGSFVTDRRFPRDIDIVLEITKAYALAKRLDEQSGWMFDKKQTAQYWIDAGE